MTNLGSHGIYEWLVVDEDLCKSARRSYWADMSPSLPVIAAGTHSPRKAGQPDGSRHRIAYSPKLRIGRYLSRMKEIVSLGPAASYFG
jgi:hypothetical protein